MIKPDDTELSNAILHAQHLRDNTDDQFHIGKCLLYLNARVEVLEQVLQAADHYVRFGMEEQEHAQLVKLIEKAKQEDPPIGL